MSRFVIAACVSMAVLGTPASGQEANPQIDYSGFLELAIALEDTRQEHRLALTPFLEQSSSDGAILLDARSAADFAFGHIEGAINLPFSEFTDAKLAQVLGEDTTRALNIPTFINLHGYGYTNVWELADVTRTQDVDWVSMALSQAQAAQ